MIPQKVKFDGWQSPVRVDFLRWHRRAKNIARRDYQNNSKIFNSVQSTVLP